MRSQIVAILNNREQNKEKESQDTLFNALLKSDLPPEELTLTRLQHEAISLVGAGVETTKWALTVASFHLLNNPPILARLREELAVAIPDPNHMPAFARNPTFALLERLH